MDGGTSVQASMTIARLATAALAGVLGLACAAGAPPGFSQGDAWVLPLVGPLEGSVLLTPVTVGGRGPYLFVLDPDAVVSSLDERIAEELDLYSRVGPRLHDESDHTRPVRVAELPSLTVGSLTVKNLAVTVHKAGAYAIDGRDVRGVLGRDVIRDSLVFGFDRDAGMAYLATREAFTPPVASVAVTYVEEVTRRTDGPSTAVPRRVTQATINGVPAKLHLDLGAVSSQLAPGRWKPSRLAPVPFQATTIDEVGTIRTIDKAGIANRVEAGPASAMGLVMIPFADKRFDEEHIDGTLGLNFFAPYMVWADWHQRRYHLTPRDGEGDGVKKRIARWDAPILTDCKDPACATARLDSIADAPAPAADLAAPPPSPQPSMPPDPAAPPPAPVAAPPLLVVTRTEQVAELGYELLLEAVGPDGRPLGLPRLAASFPPGTTEVKQRLSPTFANARFRVLDVSPFMRNCPSSGGCVFELVPPR